MVSSSSFDASVLTGEFDIDSVLVYNLIKVGGHVINSDVNAFNFYSQIGILAKSRNCDRCQRLLKLCAESCALCHDPYIFSCKLCRKDKLSVHDGTVS